MIAIANVRLFNEVQGHTRDIQELLEYQTAISEVLNVISRSPSDIQPVLDIIAETAQRLCQSEHAYVMRLDRGRYHPAAAKDVLAERIQYLRDNPIAVDRGSVCGRVRLTADNPGHRCPHRPTYVLSMAGDPGYRTDLGVPLLREGVAIGSHIDARHRAAVHRQAGRARVNLCEPGSNCDRKRAAVRCRATADARALRGA